jgi:hypothetical protein
MSSVPVLVIRLLRIAGVVLGWLLLIALTVWAAAALYFDVPVKGGGLAAAVAYVGVILAAIALVPRQIGKASVCLAGFGAVLAWWLALEPSNDRQWRPDVIRTAWVEVESDRVTIHNVRNFEYRTETEFTPNWETRTYDLRDIRGADLFVTFWGSTWIAHPILSFWFGGGDYIAFSVETRKEVDEEYSALRGFFRQYELIYIVGDERDLIRLRTKYRKGEEVYLYRTTATKEAAREIFLDYLRSVNQLHRHPAFYNAATSNCTTNIRIHTAAIAGSNPPPWDWRLLLNGKGDEFAYEYGRLADNGLPFQELRRRAHIDEASLSADRTARFSVLIREGRPGFKSN